MDTPRRWQFASLATAVASIGIGGALLGRPSVASVPPIDLDVAATADEIGELPVVRTEQAASDAPVGAPRIVSPVQPATSGGGPVVDDEPADPPRSVDESADEPDDEPGEPAEPDDEPGEPAEPDDEPGEPAEPDDEPDDDEPSEPAEPDDEPDEPAEPDGEPADSPISVTSSSSADSNG